MNETYPNSNIEIHKQALYEIVADKLELMILNDSTKFEKSLPSENFLATAFSVSRPVIREALKILKERGLINTRQGSKTVIYAPQTEIITKSLKRVVHFKNISAVELFEARIALETILAAGAAKNRTNEQIDELYEINNKLNDTPYTDRLTAGRLDAAFHQKITEISGNSVLAIMLESLTSLIADIVSEILNLEYLKDDAVNFHNKIIESIKNGNETEASELMKAHIIASMRNYEILKTGDNKKNE